MVVIILIIIMIYIIIIMVDILQVVGKLDLLDAQFVL